MGPAPLKLVQHPFINEEAVGDRLDRLLQLEPCKYDEEVYCVYRPWGVPSLGSIGIHEDVAQGTSLKP